MYNNLLNIFPISFCTVVSLVDPHLKRLSQQSPAVHYFTLFVVILHIFAQARARLPVLNSSK